MKTHLLSFAIVLLLPVSAQAQNSAAQVSTPVVSQPIYQSTTPIQPNGPGGVIMPQQPEADASTSTSGPANIVPPTPSGTARDQGYVDNGPTLSAWDRETLRRKDSARQQGRQSEVYARSNGVGSSLEDAAWLRGWEIKLTPLGIHPDKIKFEAARLTKEQFGRWASRQVWAVEEGLIRP